MKFANPYQVRDVVYEMRDADISDRSANRARINDLFNGDPPFSEQEAAENHVETNVSFLEATTLAHKARSTWNNAMLKTGYRFSIKVNRGAPYKRAQYGADITRLINRPIKASLPYVETTKATGAQVVLHGIGPKYWPKAKRWRPIEVGIEDLLVPAGTKVNLSNLEHFAIYQQFTPGELYRMTHATRRDPGWSMSLVRKELARLAEELTSASDSYQDITNPEKLSELYKSNDGYLDSTKVPTCDCWSFFHREDDGTWRKKIILDDATMGEKTFLYAPNRPFSGDLSQILHLHFGDGANVAPFRYHSVRSLGFLLYAICHLQNRLRCKFTDAVFEACLQYFRSDGSDRDWTGKIDLLHLGIIPPDVRMVPQAERWQLNEQLVVAGLSQNRQLMSENAASYVQDVNDGTAKELTATEVMARLNSSNALVSSLMSMAYTYAEYEYREIARRFTIKGSDDPDVMTFQEECRKLEIPQDVLNAECWDVIPERVMGGGNKTLELAQAKSLMEVRDQLDPPAQRIVLRNYVLAVTDDSDLALTLVPDDTKSVPPAAHDAELAIGTLMQGAPVRVRQGIDHITYVDAAMTSLVAIMEDLSVLQRNGEPPTPQQIIGLVNCIRHIGLHVQIIARDELEKQRVKQYNDAIGNISNIVKGWAQQLDQAREAKQEDGAAVERAKAAALVLGAKTKAQIAESNAVQKQRHNELKFRADQQRKNQQALADTVRTNVRTKAEIGALQAKTAADIAAKQAMAEAEPEPDES